MSTDPRVSAALRALSEAEEGVKVAQELLRHVMREGLGSVDGPFLDQKLDNLDFGRGYTARLNNMFMLYSSYDDHPTPLVTVRDLVALTESQFLAEPNIGLNSFKRVKAMLADHGLHFGMSL